jgi:DNA-binding transcriptional ArsR family regulator
MSDPIPKNRQELHEHIISMRWELRRHFLNERERLIADWLLDLTMVAGRPAVRVQRLEDIGSLTGMSRGHVSDVLRSLHDMHILHVARKAGWVEYSLNPHSESWKCRYRQSRGGIREAIFRIQAVNGSDTPNYFGKEEESADGPRVDLTQLPFFLGSSVPETGTDPIEPDFSIEP